MLNKGTLYRLIENGTPPFLFRVLKKSSVYPKIARYVRAHSHEKPPQEVIVTGGPIAGATLKVNPDGHWQPAMIDGTYDAELFKHLSRQNLAGKVVYDIGAHIGYHSMAFARYVGEKGHVYAFEPNSVNNTRAKEIFVLNPSLSNRITLLETALSNTTGESVFVSSDDLEGGSSTGGFIGSASTIRERDTYITQSGFTESSVPVDTIDHLIERKVIWPPQVLKIDVEGAEQLVLAGAEKTLSAYAPRLIVEFHSIYSTFACLEILKKYGYRFELLKREPDGRIMISATR